MIDESSFYYFTGITKKKKNLIKTNSISRVPNIYQFIFFILDRMKRYYGLVIAGT